MLVGQKAGISTPVDEEYAWDDQNPIEDDPANFLQTFDETLINSQLLEIDGVNLQDELEGYLAEDKESNAFICTDSAFDPGTPERPSELWIRHLHKSPISTMYFLQRLQKKLLGRIPFIVTPRRPKGCGHPSAR